MVVVGRPLSEAERGRGTYPRTLSRSPILANNITQDISFAVAAAASSGMTGGLNFSVSLIHLTLIFRI